MQVQGYWLMNEGKRNPSAKKLLDIVAIFFIDPILDP